MNDYNVKTVAYMNHGGSGGWRPSLYSLESLTYLLYIVLSNN